MRAGEHEILVMIKQILPLCYFLALELKIHFFRKYSCSEPGCQAKFFTRQKLLKHLTDGHSSTKTVFQIFVFGLLCNTLLSFNR